MLRGEIMNRIKLFADSTSDLPREKIKQYNIEIIPLYINFNETSYKDGVDLTVSEMYKMVEEKNSLPKTAAPSPGDYYNAFKQYIDNGDDIIYIGISSKLSSSVQNALIAASEFPEGRIEVIDSFNLSTGIGLLVLKAADLIEEGLDIKEIVSVLKTGVANVKAAFLIDTLDYLYMGGRCNSLESFFGGVLKIKPIVNVVDGGMILGQKSRGKRQKALEMLLKTALDNINTIDAGRIFVPHSMSYDDAVYLKEQLEAHVDNEILITEAGCVISSHCGPGTVGIMYISK